MVDEIHDELLQMDSGSRMDLRFACTETLFLREKENQA